MMRIYIQPNLKKIIAHYHTKYIDKYFFNRQKDIKKVNAYLSMLEDIPN